MLDIPPADKSALPPDAFTPGVFPDEGTTGFFPNGQLSSHGTQVGGCEVLLDEEELELLDEEEDDELELLDEDEEELELLADELDEEKLEDEESMEFRSEEREKRK